MRDHINLKKVAEIVLPRPVMNAYRVAFKMLLPWDNPEEHESTHCEFSAANIVIARSPGSARWFIMGIYNIWEFTYPMSIKIIEKDVPVSSNKADFPEWHGYWYDYDGTKWTRTRL